MRRYFFLLILLLSFPAQSEESLLLVLGDSISAGYGIKLDAGWVALLEKRLAAEGYPYRVKNASISGDTTSGAAARLGQLIAKEVPSISIVELGGNDGLRGLSLEEMELSLDRIIQELQQAGSEVLLIPMRLPPNYGPAFNDRFESIYQGLAGKHGVTLATFILHEIGENPEMMQADGIHPKAGAQQKMLDNIWDELEPMLKPSSVDM